MNFKINKDPLIFLYTPTSRLLCVDSLHLKSAAKSVMNAGGEGIILRKPRSPYVGGRSSYLFKFKVHRFASSLFPRLLLSFASSLLFSFLQPKF